jgi:hypothetical protein
MPSFIDLYPVDRARVRGEAGPDEADRAGRGWVGAALALDALGMRVASEPLAGLEQGCVVCGQEAEPIAVYGRAPLMIIAGRATPPPPMIVFCDQCARDHQLGPGVSLAEELINAWRTARGLPEHDFSRLEAGN